MARRSLVPNFFECQICREGGVIAHAHARGYANRGFGDYQPCEKPGPGEALVDLYSDGQMIMCVPVDALASLTAGGARVISYGSTVTRPVTPVTGAGPTVNPLPRPATSAGFNLGGMWPLLLIGVAAFALLKR